MPRIERTREENQHFWIEVGDVLEKIAEVKDHPVQKDSDEETVAANAKAVADLTDTLRNCDVLIGVCGALAKKTLEKKGISKDEPEDRPVTPEDIEILRRSVLAIKEEVEVKTKAAGKKLEETPEVVAIWQAISRLNKVRLFYPVFHGGVYFYSEPEQGEDKNGIRTQGRRINKEQWFGGIPEDKIPKRTVTIVRGNLTVTKPARDYSTSPENCRRIYEILKVLEKENPTVEFPAKQGEISRTVNRAGEAEFFVKHLPKGLKPWVEAGS